MRAHAVCAGRGYGRRRRGLLRLLCLLAASWAVPIVPAPSVWQRGPESGMVVLFAVAVVNVVVDVDVVVDVVVVVVVDDVVVAVVNVVSVVN